MKQKLSCMQGYKLDNIVIHQPVKVMKETNKDSISINPYCCKITFSRLDKTGTVTVGHIPREMLRYAR